PSFGSTTMSRMRAFARIARGGFTLIELLVVIAIIAVLVALLLPECRSQNKGVQTVHFFHRQTGLASLVLAGACFALGSAGCSDPSDVGPTVPVVGRVISDGQPGKAGTVSFRPDKSKGNTTVHEPYGEMDRQC